MKPNNAKYLASFDFLLQVNREIKRRQVPHVCSFFTAGQPYSTRGEEWGLITLELVQVSRSYLVPFPEIL